jgi:hypothetical protein
MCNYDYEIGIAQILARRIVDTEKFPPRLGVLYNH